ncbi:UDP-glucose 4-epimerase GalE [Auraticoccus sp. F435]|uniref:UDP-glucose 4-epimerase n=1 Tax=Auraticoccus cholistanensis TaxID=2656650 RepID=A0A6A9UYC1_9ACTN|nr:UDP-glucose 4-epimerase GalE [Auraticoccus cholistanensis]MVA76875.1 UDP-glucose 4-epimerase GalE [Auraticoccus cholistanensis]
MKVLLTGGAGYIGSHTAVVLLEAGHEVVVLDDLSNSSEESLRRVHEITGRPLLFVAGDIADQALVERTLREQGVEAVIHFAGKKAVGESVRQPLDYYSVNVGGTLALLRAMDAAEVRTIVFSSSATVYGENAVAPYLEKMPRDAFNPYGRTKEQIEDILADVGAADDRWRIGLLRYFNPVGAHPSGRIGEDPQGVPNNLVPFIAQVAVGQREKLVVFGDDYDTPDGTCVRDYLHVMDLADGHVAAMDFVAGHPGVHVWNLGTGRGHSVLEVLASFERAVGRPIPYEIGPRRDGDIAAFWADASQALTDLGWVATKSLDEMTADHWRWQEQNPYGYAGAPR